MSTKTPAARGRLVSWTGFVFGSLTSIAANVLHTWLPAAHMPPGWTPGIAPQIGAAVWPIGLLLSVEVLSRAQWRGGRMWGVARYGGAGAVAFGSAVISYSHVRDVLVAWGYGHPAAEFGPLTLDGLMVVCGFALMSMSTHSDPANPEHAIPTRPMRTGEPKSAGAREIPLAIQVEPAAPQPVRAVGTVSGVSGQGSEGVAAQADTPTQEVDTSVRQADMTADGMDSEADTRRQRARELHAQDWTHARIATELGVSKRTVRRYLSTNEDTDPFAEDHANTLSAEWLTALDTHHHDTNGVHA
ncbi:helix-turn-helix domain-containing protein [Nocardia sp. NBC_01503]|uniref:helix-turn-helix domain-containing protein n=1 Tax=Nocardia sp. NBC_01503 TaxID=2975997 RepID=UPI002E7AD324|nr:helix-turn-helix domain-containing protein [Nocardia sp. NBC_01503]WTL33264.1 helix-turn-helix domain-containing protein [Nocardia sp. NBC_01503]